MSGLWGSRWLCICMFGLLRDRYKGQSLSKDLLFSCCEYFVAQFDYCVYGVRWLSSLVSGFLAGFMGNS